MRVRALTGRTRRVCHVSSSRGKVGDVQPWDAVITNAELGAWNSNSNPAHQQVICTAPLDCGAGPQPRLSVIMMVHISCGIRTKQPCCGYYHDRGMR